VTLLGAVIAARVPDYGVAGGRVGNDLNTRLRASLAILRVLVRARRDARSLDTRHILGQAGFPRVVGEPVLDRLGAGGWGVRRAGVGAGVRSRRQAAHATGMALTRSAGPEAPMPRLTRS
jgi:hypothetical protein